MYPLFERLNKVRRLRNKLAHSKILPPDYNDPQVYLEYYKDGEIVKELIDTDENKTTIKEAVGCDFFLRLIEGELKRQRSIGRSMGIPANKINYMRARCPSLLAPKYR